MPALEDMVAQSWLLFDISLRLYESGLLDSDFLTGFVANTTLAEMQDFIAETKEMFVPLVSSSNPKIAEIGKEIMDLYVPMLELLSDVASGETMNFREIFAMTTKIMNQTKELAKKYSNKNLSTEFLFGVTEEEIAEFANAVEDLRSALQLQKGIE